MITLLFLLLLLSLAIGVSGVERMMLPNGEYVTRERTCMINGFFIWIVFACHITQYTADFLSCDEWLVRSLKQLGQCVVATFFFFSGYGVMSSLRNKKGYAGLLVKRRFVSLLLHMSLAVLLFFAVQTWYGMKLDVSTVVLACAGWVSIGNSNWFIFVTLVSYLFIALSYMLLRRKGELAVVAGVVVLFAPFVVFVRFRGCWWVDTCMCIPAGMLFFVWRDKFERIINSLKIPVWLLGLIMVIFGVYTYWSYPPISMYANVPTVAFAFGVCLLFSGIRLKRVPAFLVWSGGPALFTLYIFQRIPMIIGRNEGMVESCPQLYVLFCILGTLLMGWLGMKCFAGVDKLIFRTKARKVE